MIKKSYIWKSLYLESCFISCKNGKHLASIHDLVITCDEILEEIKTVPVLMKKKVQKSFYFTCLFINYDSIINSCYHLLLSDKISKKKKKKITILQHKQQIKRLQLESNPEPLSSLTTN